MADEVLAKDVESTATKYFGGKKVQKQWTLYDYKLYYYYYYLSLLCLKAFYLCLFLSLDGWMNVCDELCEVVDRHHVFS